MDRITVHNSPVSHNSPGFPFLPVDSLLAVVISIVQPGFGHSFAKTALFDELFLQRLQLLIKQIICLVDQTNHDVGDHFGKHMPCLLLNLFVHDI